jgi:hypothetical protein
MFPTVDDNAESRLKWKPSFRAWLLTTLTGLSILALTCWLYPVVRAEWVTLTLCIPFIAASIFIGLSLEKAFDDNPPVTPLKEQTAWQRFFTLLIYRKHSPKWADLLFFTGCTIIYVIIFGYFFGLPNGILPFLIAVVVNLLASLIPCMLWNFLVLILVAAIDFYSSATPDLDDEKTWLLRQVRNMY